MLPLSQFSLRNVGRREGAGARGVWSRRSRRLTERSGSVWERYIALNRANLISAERYRAIEKDREGGERRSPSQSPAKACPCSSLALSSFCSSPYCPSSCCSLLQVKQHFPELRSGRSSLVVIDGEMKSLTSDFIEQVLARLAICNLFEQP